MALQQCKRVAADYCLGYRANNAKLRAGVDFGDGFEFIFQISSGSSLGLNVVDGGSLMFAEDSSTGD